MTVAILIMYNDCRIRLFLGEHVILQLYGTSLLWTGWGEIKLYFYAELCYKMGLSSLS